MILRPGSRIQANAGRIPRDAILMNFRKMIRRVPVRRAALDCGIVVFRIRQRFIVAQVERERVKMLA